MQCPKCGAQNEHGTECRACGIIFEKYYRIQKQVQQETEKLNRQPRPERPIPPAASATPLPRYLKITISLALVLILCTVMFRYFIAKSSPEPGKEPLPSITAAHNKRSGIAGRLHAQLKPQSAIETARLATVFIQTPWGVGSGFFIDTQCRILTNKHVVDMDAEQLNNLRYQVELLEKMIERDEAQIAKAEELASHIRDPRAVEDMERRLAQARRKIDDMQHDYEELREALDKVRFGTDSIEYTIELVDKSTYTVVGAVLSEEHDLALLRLDQSDCPCLVPASTRNIPVGKRVYTIGSPLGITHTVTSGIVSGVLTHDGTRYIQTDAPINPGNSGGPLIDEEGNVIGINTLTVQGADGLGLALPIETATDAFGTLP
jgi:S1-C subfamily serine protease